MRSFTPNQFPFVIFSALSPSNLMQKKRRKVWDICVSDGRDQRKTGRRGEGEKERMSEKEEGEGEGDEGREKGRKERRKEGKKTNKKTIKKILNHHFKEKYPLIKNTML